MNLFYIIICYHKEFYHSHGPRGQKVLHKSVEGGPNLQHKIKKIIEERILDPQLLTGPLFWVWPQWSWYHWDIPG